MIAGGTGITPMLQVLEEITSNKADKTRVHLIYANISPRDVLMRETLDAIMKRSPNFTVTYVVDNKDPDWQGDVGRVDKEIIKRVIPFSPQEGKDVLIYVCGPPGMMKSISGEKAKDYSQGELDGALKELGFNSTQVYKF
jgi:cytochrome-b5 reductase